MVGIRQRDAPSGVFISAWEGPPGVPACGLGLAFLGAVWGDDVFPDSQGQ